MPEQITKYPDVTIQVLREGGARCGPGVKKNILTQCPSERFCSLPSGEMCIYGIGEIAQMTQVTPQELARVVCPPAKRAGDDAPQIALAGVDGWLVAFAAGLVVSGLWRRIRAG
jgi:hypothetical protein